MYGPKTISGWGRGTVIAGATGATGATGDTGPMGLPGVVGNADVAAICAAFAALPNGGIRLIGYNVDGGTVSACP